MTKPIILSYFSISLAVLASALYHFSARGVPANVNFTVSLVVTYSLAIVITLIGFLVLPIQNGLVSELKQLNWASFLLAIGVVGIEFGCLPMYRAGWNLGIAAMLTTVVSALILVPVAIFVFKDRISWINEAGILVRFAGLVMLNWKR